MPRQAAGLLAAFALLGCGQPDATQRGPTGDVAKDAPATRELAEELRRPPIPEPGTAIAIFAGGCFWCMEPPFDALDGVLATTSGYTGGYTHEPTYKQVSSGVTGHLEALQVVYQPDVISYRELLAVFWRNVDPLDPGGQFCDRGEQYTTAIFVLDAEQREAAEASKRALESSVFNPAPEAAGSSTVGSNQKIVTQVRSAATFYPAEDYHQNYYRTNPARYKFYRTACRRDARLEQVWSQAPPSAFEWSRPTP